MSIAEVIDSIEKDMWKDLQKRSEPEEKPEMIDCSTLGDVPESCKIIGRKSYEKNTNTV